MRMRMMRMMMMMMMIRISPFDPVGCGRPLSWARRFYNKLHWTIRIVLLSLEPLRITSIAQHPSYRLSDSKDILVYDAKDSYDTRVYIIDSTDD